MIPMTGSRRPRLGPFGDVVWDGLDALLKSVEPEVAARLAECLEGGVVEECGRLLAE